jgi:hypothetical protein
VRRLVRVATWSAFALVCSACSRGEPPGASAETSLTLSERMAEIAVRDRGDCARMGADLTRFFEENASVIAAVKTAERARSAEAQAEFERTHRARIDAIATRMMPALTACGSDPRVANAMRSLGDDRREPVVSDHPLPE